MSVDNYTQIRLIPHSFCHHGCFLGFMGLYLTAFYASGCFHVSTKTDLQIRLAVWVHMRLLAKCLDRTCFTFYHHNL